MTKYLLCVTLLLVSLSCYSDESIEVRYMGFVFMVPENPSIVATNGDENNTLIIKYGDPKGSESVIFSNHEDDPLFDELSSGEGCDYRTFMDELFNRKGNPVCDRQQLEAFERVMLQDSEYGMWASSELDIYYVIGDDRSFLIITDEDGRHVKIESGHLNEQQLRAVVSRYL